MKVDLLDRRAVDFRFGLCQAVEDSQCELALRRGQLATVDHLNDVMQMPMCVLRLVFYGQLQSAKPIFLHLIGHQPTAGQSQRIDAYLHLTQLDARVDQRPQHHVTAHTASTIEIGNPHRCRPLAGKLLKVCILVKPAR